MRNVSGTTRRFVDGFNAGVVALRSAPVVGNLVRRHLTVISYTGRRSGREFRTPVAFRRVGDTVLIGVAMAGSKTWWRNFTGTGAPIGLELDGVLRHGHGQAERDGRGRVNVTVRLDPDAG